MAMIRDGKIYRNIQEQVGKNKEDIEALQAKADETYKSIIVEEEPENPEEKTYYLAQVDDTLIPFVWDAENEEWLMVGANPDLSNYVTLNGEETITGSKTFTSPIIVGATGYDIKKDNTNIVIEADGNPIKIRGNLEPTVDGTYALGKSNVRWSVVNTSKVTNDYSNLTLKGNPGITIQMAADSTITPSNDASYTIGSGTSRFKTLNLSHYVNWGNNVLIGKDGSNRFYVSGSDGNTKIKVGQNETYFANHVEPDVNNTYNLGRAGMKWNITYTRYINNDEVNIDVNKIVTKSDPSQPILVGTFNGTGSVDVASSTLPDGVYMFTYAYAQGIAYVNKTQITTATGYGTPIRADIPVVYSGYPNWEARPGNLRISAAADDHYLIQVSDGTHHAYEGAELYAIKINII